MVNVRIKDTVNGEYDPPVGLKLIKERNSYKLVFDDYSGDVLWLFDLNLDTGQIRVWEKQLGNKCTTYKRDPYEKSWTEFNLIKD